MAKSAALAMSPTVMSIRSNDMSIHTGVTISQLHKDFESKRSAVSKEISVKISQGWTLLNLTCPRCVMPLMLDSHGQNEVCLVCGVVGSQEVGGGHSVVTAATDASSAKSKDTTVGMPTEDEFSVQSRSKWHSLVKSETLDTSDEQSKRSESSRSDIKDRILRSSMHFRRESPRGDPPAARGHSVMSRTQLEVEDSRKDSYLLPLSVATGDSAVDVNAKAHGPSPSVSSQKMDSNTKTDKESHQKEDEPIIILVDDDVSHESSQNEGATEENCGDDHGKAVFVVAIPKSVDVSRGEAATQILKAAKSSESAAGLSIDSRPSPGADSVYRLPSPGMTEASLPKMSPSSQRGHTTPNSDPRSRAASRVSYTSSQKTHQWGNTQEAKAKRHLSQPAASTQKMTDHRAHFTNQEIKQQGSFASSASGRRRVTPESPARRPRKDRIAGRSTPVGTAYRIGRASPTDSPIMQSGYASMMRTKQPMRMPLSESSSVVSSESSSSSSCLLRVAVDKPESSSSSSANSGSVSPDILVCGGGPVINLDDMDVGSIMSGTRSVTSEAIDQLLARIEDTQVELVAAEKEEDGIHKQQRLKELLGRLSVAAAAIQELDTGSRLP